MINHTPILIGEERLEGELCFLPSARGMVVAALGSGGHHNSRRSRQAGQSLQRRGFGTLMFDLLRPEAGDDRIQVLDLDLLAQRILHAIDALPPEAADLPLGLAGTSTAGTAVLVAAAHCTQRVQAVVLRSGRPDLARDHLPRVNAATLLIVGAADTQIVQINLEACKALACEKRLEIVPRATHLFQEAGTLETAAILAGDWYLGHLKGAQQAPAT
jgi:pimeloyl-ACP methyl ester carboxylesterase